MWRFTRASSFWRSGTAQPADQLVPKTILLVEDNEAVRQLITRVLSSDGYQVVEAKDGTQALEVLAQGTPIELLVTDIVMPGPTGFEVASHFIAARNVPVLFISGYAQERTDIPGPILQKPFTPAALLDTVQRLLEISNPSVSH
jgi:two-component system, cell cycle sensor histidine kinase and response regulator CckA